MSLSILLIITLVLGIIVGGLLLLKRSARKFNLTTEQLSRIKKRNETLDKREKEQK